MKFDKAFHDFGRVKKGDSVKHVYSFVNEGTEDIIIEIASGCHCSTIVAPEGKTFKPGDRGEISVTFNSETEDGDITKTVDILLINTDPKTGYPIIKEVKYRAIVY